MLKTVTKVRLLDGSSIVLSIDEVHIVIESRPYFTIAGALRVQERLQPIVPGQQRLPRLVRDREGTGATHARAMWSWKLRELDIGTERGSQVCGPH
jgi:hypothetical protein